MPSDGKIRSKFTEMKSQIHYPALKFKRNTKSFMDQVSPERGSLLGDSSQIYELAEVQEDGTI